MNKSEFLDIENWYGSYYELAIEYPKGNDAKLIKAINTIWNQPELTGPWQKKEDWGKVAQPIDKLDIQGLNHYYGLLKDVQVETLSSQLKWVPFKE